ncbi:MAG TPA: IS5 family transposase [Niabella sp.]|nr:IS5 family transposase [Niabella sp.]HQX73281.1 IS5 family transposase [Chitinophagaceae bacterium]HQX21514.1 IS5 family transposase [Niabella sp.]HRB37156.1 IS5 family transposase [Niabella sp.]HRB60634.1 IS5 family transposase [Niabella sp.]
MYRKPITTPQSSMFSSLVDIIDQQHPLVLLGDKIDWHRFEESFSRHYSQRMGKPAKPIRLMVSLLILKQLRNLSDENIVLHWSENLYFQYFSGCMVFTPGLPCSATELVEFRKRIGSEGMELIFKESIRVNDQDSNDDTLSVDTTVQEKNITYPTDTKLHQKIIKKCVGIARKEGIVLRQSYRFTLKRLNVLLRFQHTKKGSAQARKARKKIKTIAGRLQRELCRKLDTAALERYQHQLNIYHKVLQQKRSDRNKIYSLHEPEVKCYTKGKEHKKFEFGSKASILVTQSSGVIVGALNFNENIHDSKTLVPVLEQYERLMDRKPKEVYADRGYRGPKQVSNVAIKVPVPNKDLTKSQRKKHSRRAAIEPVISHLKFDYRLVRNFLKGSVGDSMNLLLSAAAFNFKRVMNLWRTEAIHSWQLLLIIQRAVYGIFMPQKLKMTF